MIRSDLRAPLLALLCVCAWLASLFNGVWPGLLRPTDAAFYLQAAVEEISQLALWVAAWSWVTYTRQGRMQLSAHISLAAGAGLLDNAVLALALPWTFFAMGWPWPASFYTISHAVLVALLGLLHLRLACEGLTPRRLGLWLLASGIGLGLVVATSWIEQNNRDALDQLPYRPNIYPAHWVQTPVHDLKEGLQALWEQEWRPDSPAERKD